MGQNTVIVYPNFKSLNYSFYVHGLMEKFDKIIYSTKYFPNFHPHCLAFIILNEGEKIFISAGDGDGFNKGGLDWCDVYAKVNINKNNLPKVHNNKILAIGPSFPIKYLNFFKTLTTSIDTLIMPKNILEIRSHLGQ